MSTVPLTVLLVEDDPGDVMLISEVFAEHARGKALAVVEDGVQAMAYLRAEHPYADRRRPDLVLLDLNLPRKSGAEVLAEIRADSSLATIPVIVLTTSDTADDVERSYRLQANAYITKPRDFHGFADIVRKVDDFFSRVVQLPPPLPGNAG